jgi:RND family efflux transporter MFP subunit
VGALTWSDTDSSTAAGDSGATYRFPVTVSTARPGRVIETVELVGDVISRRFARLAFERSGRVAEVLVDIGREVEAGDVLARLDDAVLEQELVIATSAAAAGEARAELAAREAERANKLDSTILSESERDRRQSLAVSAKHELARLEAVEKRLEAVLAQGQMRAPYDATVLRRYITDGSHAAAGMVTFDVVDMQQREVRLEIPAHIAAGLPIGAPVSLTIDEIPGLEVVAQLDLLVPTADLQTRTFTAVVRLDGLDPEGRMIPGMFVRSTFIRLSVDADTVVPADALQGPPEGPWVVVATGDEEPTAAFVPVTVLARNAIEAAVVPIEDGALAAGTQIVVTGADNVFPGAPLRPVAHDSGDEGSPTSTP